MHDTAVTQKEVQNFLRPSLRVSSCAVHTCRRRALFKCRVAQLETLHWGRNFLPSTAKALDVDKAYRHAWRLGITRKRPNALGGAEPGSQDSITRGVEKMQLTDIPTWPRSRCPTPEDPLKNDHDTSELTFDVLNAVWTRRPTLETQILVSWSIWCISTVAAFETRKCGIGRLVCSVAPFDRGEEVVAITAKRTLRHGTYLWAILSASAVAIPRSIVSRYAIAWAVSHQWSTVLGRPVPTSLPPVACRHSQRM